MRWWKALGLAGVVGVAATGVVVARAQRERNAYEPEEIRARLHQRIAEGETAEGGQGEGAAAESAASDEANAAEHSG